MDAVVDGIGLSPMQYRIMKVLQDGKVHKTAELLLIMDPGGQATKGNLAVQFTLIRQILRKRGQTVVATLGGYQWVRNILPSYE